jgi:molybdopterin converting factor small subunit
MIRVLLPTHLRRLANTNREVALQLEGQPSIRAVLDALEASYPSLRGTLRDYATHKPRPFIRFFVLTEDWTHEPLENPLPDEIITGLEPLRIVGAMAGG